METKNKKNYLLISSKVTLVVVCIVFLVVLIKYLSTDSTVSKNIKPEVLGAFTDQPEPIRGDVISSLQQFNQIKTPDTSDISANSFLVFTLDSGQELLSKNKEDKLAIASLTKLMTGLTAYQQVDLTKPFKIQNNDQLFVSPDLGLRPGNQVEAFDLFNAMLIGSENDAALALSHYVTAQTKQDFVSQMNQTAQALGMQDSSFANPVGFDNTNNFSTAADLKLLITATQKISSFTELSRRTEYDFASLEGVKYHSQATNKLLTDHWDIFAIKTGYTNSALGAMAVKIFVAGRPVVILVLDSKNREQDVLKLKSIIEQDFQV